MNIIAKGKIKELDCQCKSSKCFYTLYTTESQDSHAAMLEEYGSRVFMTSAYRCQEHNETVGGADTSNHCLGDARDYTAQELDRLYAIAQKHWKFVKKYRKFIHCDNRKRDEL